MKKNIHLSEWIDKYSNTNLLKELEDGINKDYSISVPIDQVEMNPICSKYFFRKKQITPIDSRINAKEVIDPILVRKVNNKYQVLTGFKRYYLAKKNHLINLPVNIRNVSDEIMMLIVAQRLRTHSDENILNKAYIYDAILNLYPISRKDLAKLMNTSISQITNTLRLLKLNDNIHKALKEERISYGQARMLVGLSNEKQNEFLKMIIEQKLSVRDVEQKVSLYKYGTSTDKKLEAFYNKTNVGLHKVGTKVILKFKTKELADEYYLKLLNKKRI